MNDLYGNQCSSQDISCLWPFQTMLDIQLGPFAVGWGQWPMTGNDVYNFLAMTWSAASKTSRLSIPAAMGTNNIQDGGCCQPESQKEETWSRVPSQTIEDGQLEWEIFLVDTSNWGIGMFCYCSRPEPLLSDWEISHEELGKFFFSEIGWFPFILCARRIFFSL